jgi:tetratricopeptide (TPR) repeat protein
MLKFLGRADEALAKFEKARELDPESRLITSAIGEFYRVLRQPDRTIAIWEDLIKTKGDSSLAHESLGRAYIGKKAFKKAVREFETADKIAGAEGLHSADIARLPGLVGTGRGRRHRSPLKQSGRAPSAYSLAVVFRHAGVRTGPSISWKRSLKDIN